MKKLWQKNYKLDPVIETFETKDDINLDQKLVKFDVLGSLAHAKMLTKIGILSKNELFKLEKGLREIISLNKQSKFLLTIGEEDIHTKIENYLTAKYGEVGQKIHTGRSRNDQVLTATRLFTKEELISTWEELLNLIQSFLTFAKKYEFVSMPAYTHMQKAMPSSVGMWAGSFAQNLLDSVSLLETTFTLNNQSPLGSAAGCGVPLALDREYTAKLLGFEKVQANSLAVQNARGKIEASIVSTLVAILLDINKFATDVLLYTTAEFNYFTVSEKLCSGSSMMPQKKNIDIAELLQSKVHVVLGYYATLVSLTANLSSGYNRGLQDSKKPLFDSLETTKESLKVANILINNITPNVIILEKACTSEIFATHEALTLVKSGIPFRKAYQKVGSNLDRITKKDPYKILKESSHTGATGNLGLNKLYRQIVLSKKEFAQEKKYSLFIYKSIIGRRWNK